MVKKILGLLLLLAIAGAAWLYAGASGWLGADEVDGEMAEVPRSNEARAAIARAQAETASELGAPAAKQILFGDLHVHTTFSFDAFLTSLPAAGGGGTRPPSDACDFARHCSALDFWSVNDHAENLTPRLWRETIDSVRACNALAGDPENPDLVTFLGWEWSQIGDRPDNHYGHKNVVLRGIEDDEITSRPISSRDIADFDIPFAVRAGVAGFAGSRGRDFVRLMTEAATTPSCPTGVPVRDLPLDCLEAAPTPQLLFDKLDDWDVPSIVIPHGTTWGLYTPAGSDWRKQLSGHDPARQTLLELYSGHGNSEQLPRWRPVDVTDDGSFRCPPPTEGYLPSCWRAGELIRDRCLEVGESDDTCEERAVAARQNHVDAFQGGWKTLPGHETNAWLNAGQAPTDMFQPAFNYRPRGSAQYMLAIRDFSDPANPKRFDFGFIGSSDNHTARPGTGYKEFGRGEMSEGRGRAPDDPPGGIDGGGVFGSSNAADEPAAESVPYTERGGNPLSLFEIERGAAYFVTGGLVAVHADGRSREQIWDALRRKEVYATSGRRTLLWFDLLDDEGTTPMGSTVERSAAPRFRVRAAGSFEQKPGCPPDAVAALGDRLDHLCMGECYHPGDERRPLERIEIVRIRPQRSADEPLDDLVEDPWRIFPCPAGESGCVAEFTDPEFPADARDTVYYARVVEARAPLIHGTNPLGCRWDAEGNCVSIAPCGGATPRDDDCLSEAEPRAWSSPIYVDYVPPAPLPSTEAPSLPNALRG